MSEVESFSEEDLRELAQHGVDPIRAAQQLQLLRNPPRPIRLLRPCTVGDGIVQIDGVKARELIEEYRVGCSEGRFMKFVPASGSATRMFAAFNQFASETGLTMDRLRQRASSGDLGAREVLAVLEGIRRLPFWKDLECSLRSDGIGVEEALVKGRIETILKRFVSPAYLGYAELPKGLIPFHRYGEEIRTAVEEHLVEASLFVRDSKGTCRVHFTVSPAHINGFQKEVTEAKCKLERRLGVTFQVGLSVQDPSTDTVAVDLQGRLFRTSDGRLLLRPGGHGALLSNLQAAGGEMVFIKNIDNVPREEFMGEVAYWNSLLGGYLLRLRRRIHILLESLLDPNAQETAIGEAIEFAEDELNIQVSWMDSLRDVASVKDFLVGLLDRPLRVCGMVPNRGEPGGGPFWVDVPQGRCPLQIVESAQVEMRAEDQRRIWESSTHFNPVNMVCALRDFQGRAYELLRFVDKSAVIITTKTSYGRQLRALELPGLWNGAMAEWNTVFVEIPESVFHPVKTISDLLRPGHVSDPL